MSDWRYERKFLVEDIDLREVESAIRHHPACFSPTFPPRHVNNLYLDFFDLRCFHDAVEGLARRAKYRIRWYGALLGRVEHPVLEIKEKRGFLGTKRAHRLDAFELERGGRLDGALRFRERESVRAELGWRARSLVPTLLNRYRRRYYQSGDGALRLTLDHELEFTGVGPGDNQFLRTAAALGQTIVELKYPPGADDEGRWAASRFRFRATRSSKYVQGLEQIDAA